jgi:hypothetical protein
LDIFSFFLSKYINIIHKKETKTISLNFFQNPKTDFSKLFSKNPKTDFSKLFSKNPKTDFCKLFPKTQKQIFANFFLKTRKQIFANFFLKSSMEEEEGFVFLEIPSWQNSIVFPFPLTFEISGYAYRPFQSEDLFVVYKKKQENHHAPHQSESWTKEEKEQLLKCTGQASIEKDWIFFHTHPIAVYVRFQSLFAFPSLRDVSNFFFHYLDALPSSPYDEMIWTVEGIYHFRILFSPIFSNQEEEENNKIKNIQEFQNVIEELATIWNSKETSEFFQRSETRPSDYCWWLQSTLRDIDQRKGYSIFTQHFFQCSHLFLSF